MKLTLPAPMVASKLAWVAASVAAALAFVATSVACAIASYARSCRTSSMSLRALFPCTRFPLLIPRAIAPAWSDAISMPLSSGLSWILRPYPLVLQRYA